MSIELNQWVENGCNEDALFVYGTYTQDLFQAMKTGQIPYRVPRKGMLPYQAELVKDGGFLYYATPIFARLEKSSDPRAKELALRIVANYGDYALKYIREDLSPQKVKRIAAGYAFDQTAKSYFKDATGFKFSSTQIYYLTGSLFPSVLEPYKNDPVIKNFRAQSFDPEYFSKSEPTDNLGLTLEQLKGVLRECFKRRGVRIYYNSKILDHRIIVGHEGEDEIMILSQKPLTLDVISGIEILSKADENDLQRPGEFFLQPLKTC